MESALVDTIFQFPVEEQFKHDARQAFLELHHRGVLASVWSTVVGGQNRLLCLNEFERNGSYESRSDGGIQTVSIDKICGSESRSMDFDREWRPLGGADQARWVNIACARLRNTALPAIDLIKVGDHYFVRDGHHRVSVAKSQGQMEIEANVTEWRLLREEEADKALVPGAESRSDREPTYWTGWSIVPRLAQLSTFAATRMGEVRQRMAGLLDRSQQPYNSGTAA